MTVGDELIGRHPAALGQLSERNTGFDELEVFLNILVGEVVETLLSVAGGAGLAKKGARYVGTVAEGADQAAVESDPPPRLG